MRNARIAAIAPLLLAAACGEAHARAALPAPEANEVRVVRVVLTGAGTPEQAAPPARRTVFVSEPARRL